MPELSAWEHAGLEKQEVVGAEIVHVDVRQLERVIVVVHYRVDADLLHIAVAVVGQVVEAEKSSACLKSIVSTPGAKSVMVSSKSTTSSFSE